MQHFLSFDGLINGLVSLIFGLIVLYKDRKNIVNQTLFLLTFAVALWSLSYWQWLAIYDNSANALFWSRILSVGSTFIPVFYLHWILSLLDLNKKKKWLIAGAYLLAIFFLSFSFSPLFIKSVEAYKDYFAFWPKAGWLYSAYLLLIYFGLVSYSIFLLLANYKKSSGLKRSQIKYVLLGSFFGFIGGATNFPLWYDIPVLPLGNVLVVAFPVVFSYAIIRHRLMDIRFVLRKFSVYLVSIFSVAAIFVPIRYFLNQLLLNIFSWIDFLILIAALAAYTPFRNYYYRLANKYFFSSLYDSQKIIASLSEKLRSTLDLEKIYKFISDTLIDSLRVRAFGVLKFNEQTNEYSVQFNQDFSIPQQSFAGDQELKKRFTRQSQSIVIEELKNEFKKTPAEPFSNLIETLSRLKVAILVPLNIEDEIIGMIVLGAKESGDAFNDEDLKTLEIIASQAALAVKNATLYEESLKFTDRLKAEQDKIKAIIANFIDPIIFIDKFNRLSLFNSAAKNIFGLSDKDLNAEVAASENFSLSNFKKIIKCQYQIRTAVELKSNNQDEEEVTIIQEAEKKIIYKVTTVSVKEENREFLGTLKIFYNLTQEKRINKMKTEFVSVVAHQLRTPLSGVKWALSLLLDGDAGQLNVEQKSFLKKSYASNERMLILVNDLLDVARIEEGRYVYNLAPAKMEELVKSALDAYKILAKTKKIKITYAKPAAPLPEIKVDAEKIIIAMENLIENAIKYTPAEGQVAVSLKYNVNKIEFSVKDNGVGVDKIQQDRLFTKFFRAANVMLMETDGTGLGLFIAKNIITAHNGQIWFESKEGQGSTFSFFLPINY